MEPTAAPAHPSVPDPVRASDPRRRWRVIVTALAVGSLFVLADGLLAGPLAAGGLPRQLGGLALAIGGVFLLSGVLTTFRRAWHRHLRRAVERAFAGLLAWTRALASSRRNALAPTPPRPGERLALVAGLCLTALDVVLTALLLRDVFPEPPYRLAWLGALSSEAVEWSFYVAVAGFKTGLEVWFGVVDRLRVDAEGRRSGGWAATRWFILGAASGFDAALAVSRGLLLAEQGLDGGAVGVSNLVFVGFGLAVPWVAAMTGGLLAGAVDPLLARLSPLWLIGRLGRLCALVLLWAVALGVGLPALAALVGLGLLTAIYCGVEEVVGLVMGHDPGPPPDALVLEVGRPGDEREQVLPGEPLRSRAEAMP